LEDVQKLTKYQVRLLNMEGGASQQKDVYKAKINEYGQRLAKNGVNVDRLINTIQRGGNPLDELKAQQEAALKALQELDEVNNDDLVAKIDEIQQNADKASKKYLELVGRNEDFHKQSAAAERKYNELNASYETYQEQSKAMLATVIAKQNDVFGKKKDEIAALGSKVASVNAHILDSLSDKNIAFFTFAARVKALSDPAKQPPVTDAEIDGEVANLQQLGAKDAIISEFKASKFFTELTAEQQQFADNILAKLV